MRKIIVMIIALIGLIPSVKAEVDNTNYIEEIERNQYLSNYNFNVAYNIIQNQSTYNKYIIEFAHSGSTNTTYVSGVYYLYLFNEEDMEEECTIATISETGRKIAICHTESGHNMQRYRIEGSTVSNPDTWTTMYINYNDIYKLYDTNFNLKSNNNWEYEGFYSDNIQVEIGDAFPTYKDLLNYNSWSDYVNNHIQDYETVNLNNYDYVLLTLKNYSENEAFDTNLQVKGMIGITPIYNYGQTSKDAITGIKVQDRCNVSYNNFTTYPLYILKQDLQNNVVYAVKSCEENSSFKYSRQVFNITYVTAENRADPIVTINGQQYHTIPFSDLPSTANKNEEENYIPGQSGSANDTGGLDGAVKGIQQKMSEIWNTFTYFTEFINQMFSVLPEELRIILVSAFTVMIVLGLIKIFIN